MTQGAHMFKTVLGAARAAAHMHDEKPFKVVVRHLGSGDLDVKLNALSLSRALLSALATRASRLSLVQSEGAPHVERCGHPTQGSLALHPGAGPWTLEISGDDPGRI